MKKGRVIPVESKGLFTKKIPQKFTYGPNIIAKKTDGDVVLCELIWWPFKDAE